MNKTEISIKNNNKLTQCKFKDLEVGSYFIFNGGLNIKIESPYNDQYFDFQSNKVKYMGETKGITKVSKVDINCEL